ncbi:MAG: DUF4347 domain-containing protein [Hyphomicrobiaceae bacterium]
MKPTKSADLLSSTSSAALIRQPFGGLAQSLVMRRLEPRLMFDAAAIATAEAALGDAGHGTNDAPIDTADAASDHDTATDLAAVAVTTAGEAATSGNGADHGGVVVFIDSAVTDPGVIAAAAPAGAEVVLIDGRSDGLRQIADALAGRSDVSAIHIVSHGAAGELHLGNGQVDLASISGAHADELALIRDAIGEDGDILIYGCDVGAGETGAQFIEALSRATGADIAASTDDTGSAELGGDWVLESQTGVIDAVVLEAPEWNGLMAPLTISASSLPTTSGGTGAGAVGLWTNAGSIGGTSIDIRATVISATSGTVVQFSTAFGTDFYGAGRDADDLWVAVTGGTAAIKWEIFASGTGQTVHALGDPSFRISDIDGDGAVNTAFPTNEVETVAPSLSSLTSYTVDTPTNLLTGVSGGNLAVVGSASQNAESNSLVAFDWTSVSSWQVTYTAQPGWGCALLLP